MVCQGALHFAHLPSASVTTLWGNMPAARVSIGCTAHKVVFLPGSSKETAPMYAVVVSTEVEVDMDAERAMDAAKAEENGEEYDQIGTRWGSLEEPGACTPRVPVSSVTIVAMPWSDGCFWRVAV